MELLTTNTKLLKIPGVDTRYMVRGLSLAPHKASGFNTCPHAGACAAACVLWFAGRTVMRAVRAAMIARTRLFYEDRPAFLSQLYRETERLLRAAEREDARPVVRLNVASDIVWERVTPEYFSAFPTLTVYDYTKWPASKRAALPSNYFLSHSVHESTTFDDIRDAIDLGRNVVAVFDSTYKPRHPRGEKHGALPAEVIVHGSCDTESFALQSVNGDVHDVRIPELDGTGRVVVLAGKGGAVRVEEAAVAGFVRRFPSPAAREARPAPWTFGSAVIDVR